jgi:hypothetical protein
MPFVLHDAILSRLGTGFNRPRGQNRDDVKLIYKPIGIILGIIAGIAGRQVFNVVWAKIDDQEPPEATTEQARWVKIITAAALQGAIFAAVRASVNRAGAKGYAHLTGVWPGEKRPDPE